MGRHIWEGVDVSEVYKTHLRNILHLSLDIDDYCCIHTTKNKRIPFLRN